MRITCILNCPHIEMKLTQNIYKTVLFQFHFNVQTVLASRCGTYIWKCRSNTGLPKTSSATSVLSFWWPTSHVTEYLCSPGHVHNHRKCNIKTLKTLQWMQSKDLFLQHESSKCMNWSSSQRCRLQVTAVIYDNNPFGWSIQTSHCLLLLVFLIPIPQHSVMYACLIVKCVFLVSYVLQFVLLLVQGHCKC